MLVNGISIQGDPVYGQNYFPDYKLEFGNDGSTMYFVKQERTSRNKVILSFQMSVICFEGFTVILGYL